MTALFHSETTVRAGKKIFSQSRSALGNGEMQAMTIELVDAVLDAQGRYYLPYRLHATTSQFRRAYPQSDRFFTLKRRYDPDELFQNEFYVKYGKEATTKN
jgi:FAD/FMN-containing dehydrogenase